MGVSYLCVLTACQCALLQANPLVYFDISLDNNTPLGRITMELKVRLFESSEQIAVPVITTLFAWVCLGLKGIKLEQQNSSS